MFENLRRAFREAVDNFNRELERDAVPEAVDGLIRGMQKEAVATRAGLEGLKEQLARARKRAEAEGREAEVCRRREELASKIGDTATAEVAAEFAEKHTARQRVLSDKAKAIEAEIRLGETEYADMLAQIKKGTGRPQRPGRPGGPNEGARLGPRCGRSVRGTGPHGGEDRRHRGRRRGRQLALRRRGRV
ncbi:MAG: hypothetical protein OXH66_01215 [Gemmatimonadetes bacterium]|nr:hypothetical protein [Gemmatimonadota bacterium]